MIKNLIMISCAVFFLCGCQTTSVNNTGTGIYKKESYGDVKAAIRSVAEGIAGKELSDKELKEFEKHLSNNPETQSAVKVITDSITKENVKIKYCPVCGRRYSPKIEYCPYDHAKLKMLD